MKTVGRKDIADRCELTPLDSAKLPASRVPDRVRIAPWGVVESTRGAFVVDEESTELVVRAFRRHGADLPIDYEHQTLGGEFASPTGQAPAAGWIKQIEVEPNVGVFARVEWTPPALEQLAVGQYRYLSPVALVRKADRKLVGLHSVALTNKPAIVGAEPIVHREAIDEAASEPSAVDTGPDGALAVLCARLDLEPDADMATVIAAARRRLDDLDADQRRRDAEQRLAGAMRSGRAVEAQRDFAMRLAMTDATLFDEWLRTAPTLVPMGRTMPPNAADGTNRRRAAEAKARAEYRATPQLAALTTEKAYVADALRDCGDDGLES